jgi:Flp pilus assembly protein CpaB
MQRGRFLILIGILLAVIAAGLLLLLGRDTEDGGEPSEIVGDDGVAEVTAVPPTPTPVPNPVVVAKQRIPRGTLLVTDTIGLSEWVSVESWAQGWVTQDAFRSIDQVEGKITRSDIPRGTILTADMLTDQAGDLAAIGSDAALLIPPGRVAMAIPVDHISSVGWALRRGDHVDVLVSFLMTELDEEFQSALPNQASPIGIIPEDQVPVQGALGRFEQDPFGQPINVVPSEVPQRPRLVSQITVRDAQVLNVGPWLPWGELLRATVELGIPTATATPEGGEEGQAVDGGSAPFGAGAAVATGTEAEPVESIITSEAQTLLDLLETYERMAREPLLLVVSPQDALVLKWGEEAGGAMHIVLRSYEDAGVRLPDTEPVTLQYMRERFNFSLPLGLDFGIDPAVRELERSFLSLDEGALELVPEIETGTPPR